jgi:hypothetical protein
MEFSFVTPNSQVAGAGYSGRRERFHGISLSDGLKGMADGWARGCQGQCMNGNALRLHSYRLVPSNPHPPCCWAPSWLPTLALPDRAPAGIRSRSPWLGILPLSKKRGCAQKPPKNLGRGSQARNPGILQAPKFVKALRFFYRLILFIGMKSA